MGNSTNLGSSIHSNNDVLQTLSPDAKWAHPLISKANITAINPFFNFYPPNVPIPIGISISVIVPSASTIVSFIYSMPSTVITVMGRYCLQ